MALVKVATDLSLLSLPNATAMVATTMAAMDRNLDAIVELSEVVVVVIRVMNYESQTISRLQENRIISDLSLLLRTLLSLSFKTAFSSLFFGNTSSSEKKS